MGQARKRKSQAGITPRYAGLPHVVLDSPSFRNLSATATRVLLVLLYQYNGINNGDLSAPLTYAKRWGIKSHTTLAKALRELQEADLIRRTRDPTKGRKSPHGQCALYAVTWQSLDECKGKHDLQPTITPLRKFSLEK